MYITIVSRHFETNESPILVNSRASIISYDGTLFTISAADLERVANAVWMEQGFIAILG